MTQTNTHTQTHTKRDKRLGGRELTSGMSLVSIKRHEKQAVWYRNTCIVKNGGDREREAGNGVEVI